ncbi:hypothetical protein M1555_00335 [Patescibacteria group bacterium]|nr:hypothetical protein [Patescibacteria group bacterium]
MKQFRYKNILLYSSHQWCGNTKEYFAAHTERLGVFLLMTRIKTDASVFQLYEKGKLVKEIKTPLTDNFFLYYFLWYYHYIRVIFRYFPRSEKLIVICAHPYVFFASTIQKLLRNIDFVYYIADFYPPINLTMKLYERLKRFYHNGIKYRVYLGDGVNKIMNGRVMDTPACKTIMLGVNPKHIKRNIDKVKNTLLYVGVIRPNVGLEIVYAFIRDNPEFKLKIVGVCDSGLFRKHQRIIAEYGISGRVEFPNRFFFDREMNEVSKRCFAGVALYQIDDTSTIYYADPGKVKTYTEMTLPVIMSKTSSIAPYVRKLKAGEVIDRTPEAILGAANRIRNNYRTYINGVNKLNEIFEYEKYYGEKFGFLEKAFS